MAVVWNTVLVAIFFANVKKAITVAVGSFKFTLIRNAIEVTIGGSSRINVNLVINTVCVAIGQDAFIRNTILIDVLTGAVIDVAAI